MWEMGGGRKEAGCPLASRYAAFRPTTLFLQWSGLGRHPSKAASSPSFLAAPTLTGLTPRFAAARMQQPPLHVPLFANRPPSQSVQVWRCSLNDRREVEEEEDGPEKPKRSFLPPGRVSSMILKLAAAWEGVGVF